MSKYEECPNCEKKGYYVVRGYDPNPEKGPMKRCKYCNYIVRVNDARPPRYEPEPEEETEPEEHFDIRFICSTCHGQGEVRKRVRQGPGVTIKCHKCAGTGMFATGNGIRQLQEEIDRLKKQTGDSITFTTDESHAITARRTELGLDIYSLTGDLQAMMLADNRLAVIVRDKGE